MQRIRILINIFAVPISLVLFSLFSCRDDIADPNNKGGNVNEPIVLNYYDSFSFFINADGITYDLIEQTNLSEAESKIYVSVDNYKSGYVEVIVSNKDYKSIYAERFIEKTAGTYQDISGYVPERLVIQFYNFTGNLRIELVSAL